MKRIKKNGFTLVELLVVITVMTIIILITIFNYPGFSKKTAVERASQEIALALRKAQSYAIAVRDTGGDIFPPYGIHFAISDNESYILFADTNPSGPPPRYEVGDLDVDVSDFSGPVVISDLCVSEFLDFNNPDCTGPTIIDVVFSRPDPSTVINTNIGSYIAAGIEVSSGSYTRRIIVLDNGLIYVE